MSVTPGMQIKCKICGEGEFHKIGNREVCRYCNAAYVAYDPGLEAELRMAESFRESAQFDVAATLYQKLLRTYEGQELSDVYWGLFLCEQKVMFETDEHGERFPSFYAITPAAPKESAALQNAIEAARCYDSEKAETYRALAEKITGAKELYRRIHAASKPYDIFICFKRSAADGAVTKDTDLAIDLYNNFAKNYRIFFSERSLRDVAVRDFEPNIYHALYTAKVMLLLCSKREYLESRWVKNEWSRYHTFAQNPAAGKTVIPIFLENFTPDQLPRELTSYQGLQDDRHLFDELGKTLQKILKPVDIEAELNKKLQAVMAQQAEEQRRMQEQQAEERRRMQEQLEKLASRPVATAAHGNADVETMLQRMRVFLEEKDWQNATHCADRALETDPGNGDAYLGKLLAAQKVSTVLDLRKCKTTFDTDPSYRYVLRFCSVETVDTLKGCLAEIKERKRKEAEVAAERERLRKEIDYQRKANIFADGGKTLNVELAPIYDEKKFATREQTTERERQRIAERERQRKEKEAKLAARTKKTIMIFTVGCLVLILMPLVFLGIKKYTENDIPQDPPTENTSNIDASSENPRWIDGIRYVEVRGGFRLESAKSIESSEIVIPANIGGVPVTAISAKAFENCDKLTSVTIPSSVINIENYAFKGCNNLITVKFEKNSQLKNIGSGAFWSCGKLTAIEIPDCVTAIREYAFGGCSNMNAVEFGLKSQMESIGSQAFKGCSNLTAITIPASVRSIGDEAFADCTNLTTARFEQTQDWWYGDNFPIHATDLARPATAANYLRSLYCGGIWSRK